MSGVTLYATIAFAVIYLCIFIFQNARPYIALAGAAFFVAVGTLGVFPEFSYTPLEALGEIDWNVLMMIAGTMGTVSLFIDSGMPVLMSDMLLSKVTTVKSMVIVMSLFAGIISAFVDNVATVLMIAPVALAVCTKLKISPVPVIISISLSSNLQGAATLVGDTTSILLSKAANLDFMDFFVVDGKPGMFWVTEAGAVVSVLIMLFMFRKYNQKIEEKDKAVVEDKFPALLLVLTVLTLIIASFIPYKENAAPGQLYKPEITNGLICITYFVIGIVRRMALDRNTGALKKALMELDYYTLLLLTGLFIIIGAITRAGIIDYIGECIAKLSGNGSRASVFFVYSVIVWMSVAVSAFIDNIPYTATMLPVVAVVARSLSAAGTAVPPNLLYFGLLVGATLGGNITPIGASANIAGTGILRKAGFEVKPAEFMKFGIPFTFGAVSAGWILLWLIWM
ncbi:MAG: arsenic transporter [Lachnospiraceae bacterium]|nr:arsenic transporter [Lachnospiraceae bacterium]